jgi:hypothetical protein
LITWLHCYDLYKWTRIWLNLHALFVAVFFVKKTQKNIYIYAKEKNIYAKIISIHYTYTYRFIQIHIHTHTYCIIGRFVYSFWKQFGFTVSRPVWLHDYIVTVGQPWISISIPWSESSSPILNIWTLKYAYIIIPLLLKKRHRKQRINPNILCQLRIINEPGFG